MSLSSYTDVWEGSEATGSTLLVLLALGEHYNPERGYAWPSVETIAAYARVSLRTVQRHLRDLEELGEIKIYLGGGRQNPSRYYLNFKKLSEGKRKRKAAYQAQINPAGLTPFDDLPPSETPSNCQETPSNCPETMTNPDPVCRETMTTRVLNPDKPGPGLSGEGVGNRETEEERGSPPGSSGSAASFSLPDSGLDPSDADMVRFNLAKVYPRASKNLAPVEKRALADHLPILAELDCEDWKALRIWTLEATDQARGCRLWPTNRSQFLQHAGEAVEKARTWWDESGSDWWQSEVAKRDRRAARGRESQSDDQPADTMSREEAIAFLKS